MAFELPDYGLGSTNLSIRKFLLPDDDLEAVLRPPPILDKPSAWYGHIPFANWIVSKAEPKLLVELGTHAGVSYSTFCNAVLHSGLSTRCFAVDTWHGDHMAGYYGDEVYWNLSHFNETQFAAFSVLVRSKFDDALSRFEDGSIDLLHIDGLHTYEAVRHDFETWQPKLSDRAVVLFHDTNEYSPGFGVWSLWKELVGKYPSFEFRHSHGLGVLCYGKDAPPAVRSLADLEESDAARFRSWFQAIGEKWSSTSLLMGRNHAAEEANERARALQFKLDTLHTQIDRLQSDIREKDAIVHALRDSTSWRITAPMRAVIGGLRRSARARPS